MTWGEFKRAMKAAGVKDKDEIWYFDFHGNGDAERLNIEWRRDARLDLAAYQRGGLVEIPGEFVDLGWVVYG
jgi:hypothetical protein